MYTKEQKERALKEYERLGSVQATITYLEYPSRHTLYDWYRNMLANKQNYHGSPNQHQNNLLYTQTEDVIIAGRDG